MPDFRINPLQIPDPLRATPIDFSPLADIGNTLALNRRRQEIASALGSATDPQGNIDFARAGKALADIGAVDEARQMLALGQQQAQFSERQKFAREQFEAEKEAVAPLPYGGGLYKKKTGEIVQQPAGGGTLDDDTVTAMAHQLRAGDTSVLTNLGRGAQGAENVVRVRKKLAELNAAAGEGGTEQAARQAEYFGERAGQRTLGTRSANIELAATEFKQALPPVIEASRAVNRTSYPSLNKILQAWQEGTGDPNIVAFGGGINTLVNLYARAVSPTGVGTVSDKDHAREILQKAWSQGQFDAAIGMMQKEIDAALASPAAVRRQMRERFMEGPGAAPGAAPRTAAPPAAVSTQQAPPQQVRNPSAAAQQNLLQYPETRDEFDAWYGAGASDRILGRRR